MKNEIKVVGKQEFMGKEISIIECEGGFGKNQRIITAKEVAEIHEMKLGKINELINNNIDEFEEGIDIIDMKGNNEFAILAKDNELYTQNALNASSNIYILSEQGYIALVSLMKTDKAKEIRKQFRREYFAMREVIKSNDELLAQLCLQVYKGGQDALCASKQITEIEVAKATKPLLEKIENDKTFVDFAIAVSETSDCISMNEMAKLIQKEGINLGRNKLFALLRDEKILMSDNQPYQKYLTSGYFEVIETVKRTPFGDKTFCQTIVTGKGQVFIVQFVKNKLKESSK